MSGSGRSRVVLAHGYHLEAPDWVEVAWGAPAEGRLGRAARAVLAALDPECILLYFGTGASERGGLRESQVTHQWCRERRSELAQAALEHHGIGFAEALEGVNRVLDELSWCDTTTQNTHQEVAGGLESALLMGASEIVLVSSPTHVLRCHREALALVEREPSLARLRHGLSTLASDTNPGGASASDVVVLEPPHREGRGSASFPRVAAQALPLLGDPELAEGYAREWEELTQRWRERLADPG